MYTSILKRKTEYQQYYYLNKLLPVLIFQFKLRWFLQCADIIVDAHTGIKLMNDPIQIHVV